jgi:glutamyl-tRNA reductase
MKLIVTGLNYKNTPVNIREKLAFDADKSLKALTELKNRFNGSEFVLLSTCNRVEIYCACCRRAGINEKTLVKFLSDFHNVQPEKFKDFIYVHSNVDAVRHILTVASSLDSMVVGEAQIINQVKESYRLACQAKSTGKILNRLFHCAFATAKKVYTNTSISSGRVSVAGVAVELAMQLFADVANAKVVVIGAGETGELLVQHLLHIGCRDITVINRSYEHGLSMAGKYNVFARRWEELVGLIPETDIVIASATSQNYLFEKKSIETMIRHRSKGPLLIIDVAVPRNFEPDVNNIEDVFLYSIDELSEVAQRNRKEREDDIAEGLRIIEENVQNYMDWFRAKDIGPIIGEMKDSFAQIGQQEVERFLAGQEQNNSRRATIEAITHRVVNRLLHCVIKNIEHVTKEHGSAEAIKLAEGIVQHAKKALCEPESNAPSKQSGQILRLLFWETTIKCNLSCAHCRRLESNKSAKNDLSTEQAKNLIEQLAHLGKAQSSMPVLVFSGGEPLCRKDLFELVGYAGSLKLTCALATNGTLIDSGTADRIKNSSIARVSISLDGATAEVHNHFRRLEGAFEKALEGVRQLQKRDVPFQINFTLTKTNAHQLEDIYQLARQLGAVGLHIFILVPVGCGQILAETDMLTPRQYEEKLLEISQIDARGQLELKVTCGPQYERVIRQQGLNKASSGSSKGCLAGTGILFVGHQGDVFPCGYLPVKCGNILEEQLCDIWRHNEDLAMIRDRSSLGGKCGLCSYKYICGGCRARAYAQTGDYMAAEPFCAYMLPLRIAAAEQKSKASYDKHKQTVL